jgi:transcriptional regulator with XRE-family HTH domain
VNAHKISSSPLADPAPLPYETFGEWVKAARLAKNWSQSKLAAHASCSIDAIRKIEQNRIEYRPSIQVVTLLAECLEIPLELRAQFMTLARDAPQESAARHSQASPVAPNSPNPPVDGDKATAPPEEQLAQQTRRGLSEILAHKVFLGFGKVSLLSMFVFLVLPALLFGALGGAVWFQQQLAVRQFIEPTPGILALTNREPRVSVIANGRAISNGDTIPRYAQVTVKFAIQNLGAQSLRLATLEAGARGPCPAQCTWASQGQTFSRVRNLVLQPGEIFEYEARRVLTQPGNYFVEPVAQDTHGKYGGITPFTRIEFRVEE